ncbi:MAG TPA: transposase [Candidatus Aquirickettsiella sp.]|jgi:transposase-like protein
MGRPTKFNKTLAEAIVKDVAQLVPFTIVAEAHQIHRSTLYDWINQGFADIQAGKTNTELAKFSDSIKKKQCNAIKELLNEIKKGEKGWQARAWILERRFPLEFSSYAQELLQMKEQIDHIEGLLKPHV